MRFSYASLPDHPVAEIVETIALADELGFHGAYMADETYHKDGWLIAGVAATRTSRIRLSPCVTHVILKEPTILAHTIATLDELSGGRAEAVYSIGNIAMLDQYHVDWKSGGQIERHGIDPDSLQPIFDAFGRGDVEGAIEATTLELTEKLSLSGTPEEWVERIRRDVIPTGFNHLICSPIDPFLVEAWSGLEVANVTDQQCQLRLIHDRVMPALA